MSVSYGELILDEADSGGNLIIRGTVTIALSQRVPDAGDDLIFGQAPVTGVFRAGGPPSVRLPFNDTFGPQGDDAPGTTYTITYNGVPGSPAQWSFYFISTNGDEQRLSAIASTPAAQPGQMYVPLPDTPPADDTQVLGLSSASPLVTEWVEQSGGGGGGSGTVTSVAVETANGFAGTVANDTTDAQITLKADFTSGIVKAGSGGAISAASAGTDYLTPTGSAAGLTSFPTLNQNTTGTAAGLSGTPALPNGTTATTQTAADDSTKLATTAYTDGAVATETSRAETAEALKAPLASPALTGTPTAPTATALTDNTQVATTAYADAAVAVETSRAETAEALKLAKASNLSDVASASTAYGNISPMTTLGDIEYENSTPAAARLAGNTSATKKFLTQTGTGSVSAAPGWNTIATGDVPTLNQNTSGTAAGLSATLAVASGGTGQTSQQAAMDALAGAVTSGDYLRGNGSNVQMSAIQAADVPTLNQNTTGNAATATNLAGGATLPDYLAPKAVTLTFVGSGTTLVDASLGNAFNLTLTASTTTLGNPSNAVDGEVIRFRITQGSGGSFTLSYGTAYDFGTAGAPTPSTTAAKVDILGFEYVASISKWCYLGSGLGF